MHGTVLRCHKCGSALQTKRRREPIEICFCVPWRGQRGFVELTQPRELGAPGTKFVLLE
jgi:hypothetical protein